MFAAPLRAQYPTNLKSALSTQLNALLLVPKVLRFHNTFGTVARSAIWL